MTRLLAAFALLVFLAGVRADDIESRLLQKFDSNAKANVEKLRKFVDDSLTQAKAVKDADPDAALDLVRQAGVRIDRTSLLSYADRKALTESIQPILHEMRATRSCSACRGDEESQPVPDEYLENVAPQPPQPGRSGPGTDRWEPAYGFDPAGKPQLVQLQSVYVTPIQGRETRIKAMPT